MRTAALRIPCLVFGLAVSCGNSENLAPLWPTALTGGVLPTTCGDVTISPSDQIFASSATITLTSTGQYIRYTTDGTTPTTSSLVYSAPLTISQSGTINARSSCGNVLGNVATKTFTVFPGSILFVSPTGSDATGTGAQSNPYATPGQAVAIANAGSGVYNILIAAGTYNLTPPLTINSGRPVSVWGGYNATDWSRNISSNVTRFIDSGTGVGRAYLINFAVAGTSELVVDGITFDVGAMSGLPSATAHNAIEVIGAAFVRISNNTINLDYQYGAGGALGASAIFLNPNTAFNSQRYRIFNNKITVKNSQSTGQGVGNTSTVLRGIQTANYAASTNLNLDIYNNLIYMPHMSDLGAGNYYGIALNIDEGNGAGGVTDNRINVRNNTIIIQGEGAATYAYRAIAVGTKTDVLNIENNIMYATNSIGLGVWVNLPAAVGYTPSIRNNNFFQLEAPYATGPGPAPVTIGVLNALPFAMTSGLGTNYSFDLVDGANTYFTNELSDWTLRTEDPSSGAGYLNVKTGGMNGSVNAFGFTTDLNGTTRTGSGANGWSIGAFEQDQ